MKIILGAGKKFSICYGRTREIVVSMRAGVGIRDAVEDPVSAVEQAGEEFMDRRKFIAGIPAIGGAALNAVAAAPKETRSIRYAIKGFTCVTCAVGLEVMLREQKGVTSANASYPEKRVVIGFDGTLTSPIALKEYIAQCGFSVVDGK